MKKVLLLGGTGNLGRHIAYELRKRSYYTLAIARNQGKAALLKDLVSETVVADVTQHSQLVDAIFKDIDIVISALGKSVSLNDKSKPSFRDIDYQANKNILDKLQGKHLKKFIYVSAFNAEQYPDLKYFKTHVDFTTDLAHSGIPYTIVKPTAIFSAFTDLIPMARKGQLISIGSGERTTNPIYEGDLAAICVDAIDSIERVINAGGKQVYTRKGINDKIYEALGKKPSNVKVPMGLIKAGLPILKLLDRNMYDKLSFYLAVMEEDLLAPKLGKRTLEDYLKEKV